ncbi:glucans biosynthesis glucosyltransferase MdoH [Rhodoplanes serenus]|uniref:Glucans biosynthesis glucosyltransferase H n=1 Tax=Rhodoplanes serenus TaxID=200615 RepID=A0A9X4XNQ5_9BRAD|nr:glucans biosynthesis glucosyltransferase MdoH [Rhodoplanes serenus]MTW17589.1 glucans biosynthesis glucosyltransferase MdoH [Rhodoplanes serenus]
MRPAIPADVVEWQGASRMSAEATAAPAAEVDRGLPVAARRALFATLVAVTLAALVALMVRVLAPGGFGAFDLAVTVLFAVTLPWTVIGFWNAVIGFLILRFADDPVAAVLPGVARVAPDAAIAGSTAILLCVRNEPPERVVRNLRPLVAGLAGSPYADRFHVYVLSDTSDPAIAVAEEAAFAGLAAEHDGRLALTYRRRRDNAGFKAGNIADFCNHYGDRHDYAVTLDADSVMPAEAVLRLVRIMEADPRLGILQGLVIGMPATSAFARLFQFSMRLGMRSYTVGSAWWQADCGPYWGHNAVLRLKPFMAHCELSALPGTGPLGGHVLSHDQIEAVLMRRAGYAVRVLPEETLGFEENPPTLIEFVRRDLRWCQGNMQYWRFLGLPGLRPVSRYQLLFAILMFLGSPAWIGLAVMGAAAAWLAGGDTLVDPGAGGLLVGLLVPMWFAPQLATLADMLTRRDGAAAFGGRPALVANAAVAMAFMQLLVPIMWLAHTVFLAGLPFGRAIGWQTQTRVDHAVSIATALRLMWPQTLLGLGVLGLVAAAAPAALPVALLIAAGPALAVPLAVVTASPVVGRLARRLGLAALPEERAPPAILRAIAVATHDLRPGPPVAAAPSPAAAELPTCSRASAP